MPFESKSQQRFMFAKHPEMAKEWADKTPDISALPEHVKKMADGGTSDNTSGFPNEPGVQDASVSDFLAPFMLGPSAMEEGAELPAALKGLGEAGEVTLGRVAPKMEEAAAEAAPKVEPFIKGIQKSPNGNEIKIWGVRGDPDEIAKLGYGSDPGSVPEHILRQKGVLPESVDATAQNAPNAYADGGIVDEAKAVKSNAQKADDIDPVVPSTPPPATSTDTVKSFADGGYPHVTFMEDQTPEQNKETTHLAKSHEEPKMAKGGFLEGLKKGALHKEMGISEDKNIPAKKLEHAANSDNETLRKRAQFAINAKKWHHAEGGPILSAEDRNAEPTKPKDAEMSHEKKLNSIYKAMGIKKYADGGDVTGDVDASQLPGGNMPAPNPSDPTYWDQIKAALSKVANGPAGTIAGMAMNPVSGIANAVEGAAPAITSAEGPVASNIASAMSGGATPTIPAPVTPALPPPVDPLAGLSAGTPATPPALVPPPTHIAPPANNAPAGMPNLGSIFNQDTSSLTQGVNPEDRQALMNKLQSQQHGLGAIIAQAVAGLGDALAAKGHVEQHSLQNIFAMNTQQRQEALANFDQMRQDKMQKLQLQTQMGDNALKQAAAADAYGVDEHLNNMVGAPTGTMKKDLPTYFSIMSSQIAAKEKDEDLYMKSHAQASTDVDNAVKNSSILGIKPSPAQLQASGSKLADQYYNRAKGNVLVKPSDGGQAQWIPAQNISKARQMDPNLQIVQ